MIQSSTTRSSVPPRKTQRRWHIAPVILHGPEALEGAAVLEEFPDPFGVLAAALACPNEAQPALQVARLAEQREEHARSETWLRRTITVARRSADWTSYTVALLRLGHLYRHRGNKRVAKRFFVRALRASSRRGLQSLRAEALAMLSPPTSAASAGA